VAQGERLADLDVAVAVVGVVVQVAAAEACGGDADLEFVRFRGGEGAGFLGVLLDFETSVLYFRRCLLFVDLLLRGGQMLGFVWTWWLASSCLVLWYWTKLLSGGKIWVMQLQNMSERVRKNN
jgi:hypothetical protein